MSELRPIGTEFEYRFDPHAEEGYRSYSVHRFRVIGHSETDRGCESETVEIVEVRRHKLVSAELRVTGQLVYLYDDGVSFSVGNHFEPNP